jgi:pyrroline-5-carboxylate reductase
MKTDKQKIGIIGTGNMGSAIIKGAATANLNIDIIIFDSDKSKINSLETGTSIIAAESAEEVIKISDIIILAVKPDTILKISSLLKNFKGVIISIAAGISINSISNTAGNDKKIIRAMPNTPVTTGCGMTVLSHSPNVTADEIQNVKTLFASIGEVLIMDEKHMNAVTAISGSGPAYIFTFIQAMADAGVKLGIPRAESLILAGQTILGSAKMFLDKKENPMMLRDKVTSPGGTTIAALHILEKAGFSGIIIDAIETAANRAKELDKP